MSEQKPQLEELIDFPSLFTFRAVASARATLAEEVRTLVESGVGRPAKSVEIQASKKGAFSSVRVTTMVHSADEVRGGYAALKGLDGLKLLL